MSFLDIQLTVGDGLGVITLNRPERGNSVTLETLKELCDALDRVVSDDAVKVVTLRAEGKNFCAGAEFGFLDQLVHAAATDTYKNVYSFFQGAMRRLYHCPKPTIALVSGAAVTVGCELAVACDFRIVSDTAFFQESWIKLGLMAPLGGLFLLPRIVGLARAKRMLLRGERMSAREAVDTGLALESTAPDALDDRGRVLARELAALPALAYQSAKQGIHRGLESTMEAEWTTNALNQALLIGSAEFKQSVEHLITKKK